MFFHVVDRLRHKAVYCLVVMVMLLGFGLTVPTAVAADPVPPVSCVASFDAAGSIEVTWPEVVGADVYVVYRSVNGSPDYWRGRVSGLGFVDSDRSGSIVYKVASKSGDVRSDRVTCTSVGAPVLPPDLVPPVSCVASFDAAGSIEVTWPEVVGADVYVVYRSVNGSPDYWRGRVSGLGFVDSDRSGSIVYKVASKSGDVRSDRVTCTSEEAPGGNPVPDADFLAVGDFARCNPDGATAVGNLLDDLPQPIWGLGDYAYPDGTAEQFANCFDPKIGRHKQRFSPVVGNHEYRTPGASPYFDYFGTAAGDPTLGYYSQDHGDWQVLFLNTSCGQVACSQGSAQYQWLESQLQARPDVCRAVVMHHPRWSSYGPYASADNLSDITELLYSAGTDIILAGHAHHYERLERVDPNQQVDLVNGFRHFTVGTGGIAPRTPEVDDVLETSEKLIVSEFGVLALDLGPGSYSWNFVDVDQNILDSGSDSCIN